MPHDAYSGGHQNRTFGPSPSVALTARGLVCAGSLLAAMTEIAGRPGLALAADRDRILAMLSVAKGRPVGADALTAIAAASDHWRRGDKALANLRLVFAGLPRLDDPGGGHRLALAADLLDNGLSPDALMKALWPEAVAGIGKRYDPEEPRVPAGSGRASGQWEFGGGSAGATRTRPDDGRIVIATGKKPSPSEEALSEEEELRGQPTPEQNSRTGARSIPLAGGRPASDVGPSPAVRFQRGLERGPVRSNSERTMLLDGIRDATRVGPRIRARIVAILLAIINHQSHSTRVELRNCISPIA